MTTILPARILVDEALRIGQLWLENDHVHVVLPPRARWLLLALKAQRADVIAECMNRWMRPGVPYETWKAEVRR